MKKRKGYKHLLNYCANLIMILFEMMCFSYVWFVYYNPLMTNKFGERGHWGVIGLYVLLAFFFTQSLGGFHIGYLEASDIFSSHALAIIMSAVVEYFGVSTGVYVSDRDHIQYHLDDAGKEFISEALSSKKNVSHLWQLSAG